MTTRVLSKCLAAFGVAVILVSCLSGKGRISRQDVASPSPSATPIADAAIRLIDFANSAYPNFPDYSDSKATRITLKPGEAVPSHVNYGDITGDSEQEAMVVLPIESRGSAIPYYVYIFTMEKGKLTALWDFETGDRADGGLRRVYAENGQLVIELYGKDRTVGSQLYRGDEGLCCPTSFTRAKYKWNGNQFELVSKETLSNPRGDANLEMPRYERSVSP